LSLAALALPVLLVALATATVLDALRREGALARPEFYLLTVLIQNLPPE